MRTVINGYGFDTTTAVQAWLSAGKHLLIKHLYLIGEADHPQSIWITDYESPILWNVVGTFYPSVVRRGRVTSKIGLEPDSLDITWSPRHKPAGKTIRTATPYQLARQGYYDNWPIRIWTVYMPTPGDANTFGCSELWGGRVSKLRLGQDAIFITSKSFLDIVNQYVPTNVIDLINTTAGYQGATPPDKLSKVPRFVAEADSSTNVVVGYQISPNAGGILHTNSCRGGFLVFESRLPNPTANPPDLGDTLGGVWASIQQNTNVRTGGDTGGGQYNQFILIGDLPWPPTANQDTFYVSGSAPMNQGDLEYYGFPYVPSSETAI